MPTSKTSLGFKLIAVRVLPGCVQHIRKCLVENHFYYLNNDYRISEDGKLITRRSSNIAPLSASFFSLSEKQSKGVRLNFSAIVGMNGDGKSSLVELIIRILNNASIIHEIGEIGTLLWIQGVNAELYYHLDGIFYRLVTTEDDARIYRYVETGNVYKQDCIVGKEMLKKLFFYTMVSNYSLYAYNSLDIPNEWESKNNNQKDEEYCWLHHVFHKNDGYQTPLSLHPYRSYGNIDMNREKFLSMQRLLSLMVHPHPANPHSNPSSGTLSLIAFFALYLGESIMFPTIFSLALRDAGTKTKLASSLLIMTIVGGAVAPVIMGYIADTTGSMAIAFLIPLVCYGVIGGYAAMPRCSSTDVG